MVALRIATACMVVIRKLPSTVQTSSPMMPLLTLTSSILFEFIHSSTVKLNGKRTIVINAQGAILRKAFEWKAQEHLTDEAIRVRLAQNGIYLCHQRVADIFRNPFYCGLIAHNMLDGAVIPGNHEGIISKELFLR